MMIGGGRPQFIVRALSADLLMAWEVCGAVSSDMAGVFPEWCQNTLALMEKPGPPGRIVEYLDGPEGWRVD